MVVRSHLDFGAGGTQRQDWWADSLVWVLQEGEVLLDLSWIVPASSSFCFLRRSRAMWTWCEGPLFFKMGASLGGGGCSVVGGGGSTHEDVGPGGEKKVEDADPWLRAGFC